MTSPILITGASGNVGAEVARLLLDDGRPVRAAVRRPDELEEADWSDATNLETVAFDFTEPSTWAGAFEGVEAMFLMRPPAIANIARDMLPALRAAEEAGVRHVVLLSLLGAENNPVVPHRKLEVYLEESSTSYTFLRPSFFMQNLSTTHRREIAERDEIFVPAGGGKTSFIDVRDVAEVAKMALVDPESHSGCAYELTGSEALSFAQVADILSEELGRPINYTDPSLFRFARRLRKEGHPWGYVGVVSALYTVCRLGLADTVTDELERLLGRPPTGFREFVQDYREVWVSGG